MALFEGDGRRSSISRSEENFRNGKEEYVDRDKEKLLLLGGVLPCLAESNDPLSRKFAGASDSFKNCLSRKEKCNKDKCYMSFYKDIVKKEQFFECSTCKELINPVEETAFCGDGIEIIATLEEAESIFDLLGAEIKKQRKSECCYQNRKKYDKIYKIRKDERLRGLMKEKVFDPQEVIAAMELVLGESARGYKIEEVRIVF